MKFLGGISLYKMQHKVLFEVKTPNKNTGCTSFFGLVSHGFRVPAIITFLTHCTPWALEEYPGWKPSRNAAMNRYRFPRKVMNFFPPQARKKRRFYKFKLVFQRFSTLNQSDFSKNFACGGRKKTPKSYTVWIIPESEISEIEARASSERETWYRCPNRKVIFSVAKWIFRMQWWLMILVRKSH